MSRRKQFTEDEILGALLESDLEDFSSDDELVDATWELPSVGDETLDDQSDEDDHEINATETPQNVTENANRRDIWRKRPFDIQLEESVSQSAEINENNLPVQALLILDNAPAHPPNLEKDILEELKFIKVLYLPPNTTPILQPMDQQVISNFKKLYTRHLFRRCFEVTENTNLTLREFWKDHFNIAICLQIIDQAWLGVTTRNLTSAWKKLWPEAVAERIYEELEPGVSVEEEIISLGKSMGLEVEERDVNELIEEHSQELTTEEIQELQSQQHTEVMQEIGFEESVEEVISTSCE
ncbi:tigger transposable element-derived protein 1-like [Bactrocera neohumeralis]|uniref:tigger transposable element-derived protein 1-like n=1 Tax=Bactrocera neohumeralis TaxID=98809 RepID=UPI00216502D2|nr:tigger transposable element-derived protein 1-like [Bactrocera neohumeralis]